MRSRKSLFIANWKMNKTVSEAELFFWTFNSRFSPNPGSAVVICPPFTLLQFAVAQAQGRYAIGAQDVHWETEGAYTGEISPKMLKDLGCKQVIIGHSERRQYFGETNETVNRKTLASHRLGLVPVVCVGETLNEMQDRRTRAVVEKQVVEGLRNFPFGEGAELVLAYEPVWAIGTGKSDTPEQSNSTIGTLRELIAKLAGKEYGQMIRILYGGSVKPENIAAFMSQPEIDGGLVGGASLDPESFLQIISTKN